MIQLKKALINFHLFYFNLRPLVTFNLILIRLNNFQALLSYLYMFFRFSNYYFKLSISGLFGVIIHFYLYFKFPLVFYI